MMLKQVALCVNLESIAIQEPVIAMFVTQQMDMLARTKGRGMLVNTAAQDFSLISRFMTVRFVKSESLVLEELMSACRVI
jgi:hypothetical protein